MELCEIPVYCYEDAPHRVKRPSKILYNTYLLIKCFQIFEFYPISRGELHSKFMKISAYSKEICQSLTIITLSLFKVYLLEKKE